MGKPWRPENWDKRYREVLTKSPSFLSEVYEAGADAMLKSLRGMGIATYLDGEWHRVTIEHIAMYEKAMSAQKGYLVFIPNEEEKTQ